MVSKNNQRKQTGGRVSMPAEYYGGNSGRYFPEGSSQLNIGSSAYGTNYPTSRGTLIGQNLTGPDLGATRHSGVQTGGYPRVGTDFNTVNNDYPQRGGAFQFITNPETNRKVNVNTRLGQKILNNYLQLL